MQKRLLSLALALILCFTFGSAVFAAPPPIPQIVGVANNTYYKANVKITFTSYYTAKLDGKAIKSGVVVSTEGTHKFVYTGLNKAVKTITFYIDKTLPVITLNDSSKAVLKSGATTNKSITVTYKEANFKSITITKNGKAVSYPANKIFSGAGTYIVTVTDKAGNAAKATFTIRATFVPDYSNPSQINTRGNSVGNSASCTGQGDWIYYSNSGDNGNLYKIKTNDTGKTKLNSDISNDINVVGDWIYYSNSSDNEYLYKIKTDGTGRKQLNSKLTDNVNVVGDWIYYLTYDHGDFHHSNLYKMKTDGTGETKLHGGIDGEINVVGDWIYYVNQSDGCNLYKIKTDGTCDTKVVYGMCSNINVIGDWIYLVDQKDGFGNDSFYIYKIKTDGTGGKQLNSTLSSSVNVVGDTIYFKDASYNYNLNTIFTDGSYKSFLGSIKCNWFSVFGDWIYYEDSSNYSLYKVKTDGTGVKKIN